jgi:hypothetical protein
MKYIIALTFLFSTIICQSQNTSIEIRLTSDSTIHTDYIKLKHSPMLGKPYIRVHNNSGIKIKIKDISSYEGFDKFGNYRSLKAEKYNYRSGQAFNERLFLEEKSGNISMYYDRITFGSTENSSTLEFYYYRVANKNFKTLNYRNISDDLKDFDGRTNNNLKWAKRIKFIQFSSAIIGTAILTNLVVFDSSKLDAVNINRLESFSFFASGIFLTFPLTLEKIKRTKLKNALKTY